MLISMLNKFHFNPIEVNERISEEVFNDFIERLDPDNNVFLSSDITSLLPFKKQILSTTSDEQACAFLDVVSGIYLYRLQKADSIIKNILQKPFNYSTLDSITFMHDYSANFTENEKELEGRWQRRLKYQSLEKTYH